MPVVLIAVVVSTILSKLIGFADMGGAIVGVIPKGLPGVSIPEFNFEIISQLATSAIVISLVGFMVKDADVGGGDFSFISVLGEYNQML